MKTLFNALTAGEHRPEPGESVIKCLFPVRAEAFSLMSPLEKSSLKKVAAARPIRQANYTTPGGHFKVHYDTTGTHAVPLVYSGGTAYPDWIIETGVSLEWSWTLLIDSLGFRPPPVDSIDGNETDVYLTELFNENIYGDTRSEFEPGFLEDTVQASYMRVDNDYSENIYYSQGVDGLHVTAVHEFFHVVQLGYNFRFQDIWFFELASTWSEDAGYDNVNDYIQYIESYFFNADRSLYDTNGYQSAVFGKFLEENYSINLMRTIWENMVNWEAATAINKALIYSSYEEGGLKTAFGEFALWNWFTGSRKIAGGFYEEGSSYPEIEAEDDTTLFNEVVLRSFLGLNQLSFHLYKIRPAKNVSVKATFTGENGTDIWSSAMTAGPPLIVSLPNETSTNLVGVDPNIGLIVAAANSSFLDADFGREGYSIEVVVTGAPPSSIVAQYPNPLTLSETVQGINIEYKLGTAVNEATFTVYDLLGRTIYSESLGGKPQGEDSYTYYPQNTLANGIYLYQISGKDVKAVGKFTLLR